MKLDITDQEQKLLIDALDLQITSSKRAQKNAKQLDLEAVWRKIELELHQLKIKITGAK